MFSFKCIFFIKKKKIERFLLFVLPCKEFQSQFQDKNTQNLYIHINNLNNTQIIDPYLNKQKEEKNEEIPHLYLN